MRNHLLKQLSARLAQLKEHRFFRLGKFILTLVVCSCLVTCVAVVFSQMFGGFSLKDYDHLAPEAVVVLEGDSTTVQDLAARYCPFPAAIESELAPLRLWYEVQLQGDTTHIVYFYVFQRSKKHLWASSAGIWWDFLVKGASVDILYLNETVDCLTGRLLSWSTEDVVVECLGRNPHKGTVLGSSASPTRAVIYDPESANLSRLRVILENGSLRVEEVSAMPVQEPTLSYLDERNYVQFKFSRRSRPAWMR